MKSFARMVLKLLGWQLESRLPDARQYIVIGAYHTSNWDFPLGLLTMWALGFEARWVAKHTLFRGPMGPVMKFLGGIPVDRSVRSGFIQRVARLFREGKLNQLVIAPEGTRSKTEFWKSGFYHIAVEAGLPIALGYIDYPARQLGVGSVLHPSGNIVQDFEVIRAFYRDKTGLRPENQGEIRLREDAPGNDSGNS